MGAAAFARPSTPIAGVLSNSYQRNWLAQQKKQEEKEHGDNKMRATQRKATGSKTTNASRLSVQSKLRSALILARAQARAKEARAEERAVQNGALQGCAFARRHAARYSAPLLPHLLTRSR